MKLKTLYSITHVSKPFVVVQTSTIISLSLLIDANPHVQKTTHFCLCRTKGKLLCIVHCFNLCGRRNSICVALLLRGTFRVLFIIGYLCWVAFELSHTMLKSQFLSKKFEISKKFGSWRFYHFLFISCAFMYFYKIKGWNFRNLFQY